jgi:hypothetical protein
MGLRTQTPVVDQFDCGGGFPLVSECRRRIFREIWPARQNYSPKYHAKKLEDRKKRDRNPLAPPPDLLI